MKKLILIPFVFLIIAFSASSYPIIVSDSGTNHTLNKAIVKNIPFDISFVREINFIAKPYNEKIYIKSYAYAKWDKFHNCYYSTIWVDVNIDYIHDLYHELGHIYQLCELKQNVTTEEFADSFAWSYLR